ncbi:Glucosamine-phosphate N-acetyltransferase [Pseudoloma neurophilia]|uniref:Glucosamine 6-phosphate N-acetyltransferase n=1 Tax=Pseudoloma neurophilia TaxID=146866 RepID=A0A0R0LVD3_9MICR|nr:Glucosamine-phosphate N-acetyltransferase [Pseudoloma neurophilia]
MEIVCREIERNDFGNNFPEILAQLTVLGDVKNPLSIYDNMIKKEDYKIFIIKISDDPRIIGAATLHLERKFIHGGKPVGNIEDVVVDENHRAKGFGRILVEKCYREAKRLGCYKAKLTCSEKNVAFYEKLGFERKGVEMGMYFEYDKQQE